jgi:ATP/ADP translocase
MKKVKKDIDTDYIERLEKHIENAQSSTKYSSDRFDILIVTISTTALIVTIGSVKNFIGEDETINLGLLKASWLLFVITIIANLLSQLTSYYAHKYDIKVTRNIIRKEKGKPLKGNQNWNFKICAYLSNSTQILNLISIATLIAAIITIVKFYSKNI